MSWHVEARGKKAKALVGADIMNDIEEWIDRESGAFGAWHT